MNEPQFIQSLRECSKQIHALAYSKGWWEKERNNGELIALIHSELSEALEALRHGNPPDDKIPEFNGATAELADAVIRILDMCQARMWPIENAILAKMRYNETRPHRHGGKSF